MAPQERRKGRSESQFPWIFWNAWRIPTGELLEDG